MCLVIIWFVWQMLKIFTGNNSVLSSSETHFILMPVWKCCTRFTFTDYCLVLGFRAHSCTAMSWAQCTRPHRRYPWWRSYNIRNYPPTAISGTWQWMRKPKPSWFSKAWGFGVGHQQCTLSFWKLRAQNRYAGFITPRYQFIAILFRLLTLEQSTAIY